MDARTKAALAAQVGFKHLLLDFGLGAGEVANDGRNEPIPRIHQVKGS